MNAEGRRELFDSSVILPHSSFFLCELCVSVVKAFDTTIHPMQLSDLVQADDIILGVRAHDVAGAAAEILGRTLPRHGFAPDTVRRLIDAVIAREREMPTTCGASAIPHARDVAVKSFVAAIGTNGGGIIEGQREPRVIIAFLSPLEKHGEHLQLLAALSRLAHDTPAMNAIAEAKTAEDAIALLKR